MVTQEKSLKEKAALAALEIAKKIAVKGYLGLGTGSTADPFTKAVAKAFSDGTLLKRPACVTSLPTADLCQSLGIDVIPAIPSEGLILAVDGADDVELTTGNVIKGGGAAALAEKCVARAALQNGGEFIVVVDESKVSNKLGSKFIYGVPVHVRPEARFIVKKTLENKFNAQVQLREAIVPKDLSQKPEVISGKGGIYGPLITREGDLILDVRFPDVIPQDFDSVALTLPGVTGTGLFAKEDSPTRIITAYNDGSVKETITLNGKARGITPLL